MMRIFEATILSIVLTTTLFGYVDDDIDGVDDSKDLCLDTLFDEVVDDDGCSPAQLSRVINNRFTIELGSEITFNDISKNNTNISFFTGYTDQNWDFSLSTNSYTSNDLLNTKDGDIGDIYLSAGYIFRGDDYDTRVSIGSKISINSDVGTGENDFYTSIFFDYLFSDNQDLFVYYGYTISGDSKDVDYDNFSSVSIGSGYALSDRWYSSLSYDFSESNYRDEEDYQAISWLNTYNFSKSYYMSFNYITGLDDLSYDHTISLRFGVNFE